MAAESSPPRQGPAGGPGPAPGLAVFAGLFALYAAGAAPTAGFLDSGELAAAAVELGVPHSPGHPLPALIGRLVGFLPLGDLAFRVNLASALCAALAAALLARAASRLIARAAPKLPAAAGGLLAVGVALGFGLGWAAFGQAVRAEVYALHAALAAGVLGAALEWDATRRSRHLWVGGLCAGLALANHHLTALLLLVPIVALVFLRPRAAWPRGAAIAGVALLGAVGLLAYLYLPIRAATHPRVDWGAPTTPGRLLWTISGAAFAKNAGGDHASPFGDDVAQVLIALVEDLGPALSLLATLGLALAARRGLGRVALAVVGVALCAALGRAFFGFDPETPDHHAYLLPALLALSLAAAVGGAAMCAALGRGPGGIERGRSVAIAAGVGAAAIAGPLWLGRPAAATWAYASDDLADAERALPPRAVALTTYFQTRNATLALQVIDGARPDVAFVDRGFMTYPGSVEEARRRYPELAALLVEPPTVGRPSPIGALDATLATRPIAVELDPTLDRPLALRLVPRGRYAEYRGAPPDEAALAEGEAADRAAREALGARLAAASGDDREAALAAVLWYDFNRVGHYCGIGRRAAAAAALGDAARLAPDDATLAELARSCGLPPP